MQCKSKMCKKERRLSRLVNVRKHKNQSNWSSLEQLYSRNFREVYKDLIKANGLASNKSFPRIMNSLNSRLKSELSKIYIRENLRYVGGTEWRRTSETKTLLTSSVSRGAANWSLDIEDRKHADSNLRDNNFFYTC